VGTEGLFTARKAVVLLEITSVEQVAHLTDERHGNSILKNEQHVFTLGEEVGNTEEK
jgi:hypothetical protein